MKTISDEISLTRNNLALFTQLRDQQVKLSCGIQIHRVPSPYAYLSAQCTLLKLVHFCIFLTIGSVFFWSAFWKNPHSQVKFVMRCFFHNCLKCGSFTHLKIHSLWWSAIEYEPTEEWAKCSIGIHIWTFYWKDKMLYLPVLSPVAQA